MKKPFVAEIVKDSKLLLREVISVCGDFPQKQAAVVDIAEARRILRGKELEISERSGIRPVSSGFFVPGIAYGREAAEAQDLARGNTVGRLRSDFNLPATSRLRLKSSPRGFSELTQESSMRQLALAADAAVVTQFQFHTHAVRVVARDGEPWFVLADVAEALGYRDAANAGRCLADKQRGTQIVSTPSGDQPMTLVNESGLYRLVLRSRKPEAIAFSDWVTGEVLPSIRKTGGYQQDTKAADTDKLRKAFALGADASAAVQQAVFEGVLAGAADPLWKFNRWLLAFAPDGKPYIKGIDHDEMIGSLSRITEMVSDHSLSPVTDAELANLASAGISRLAERIRRRNVEQAQERTA